MPQSPLPKGYSERTQEPVVEKGSDAAQEGQDIVVEQTEPEKDLFLEEEGRAGSESVEPLGTNIVVPAPTTSSSTISVQKDVVMIEVEKVLEEGLGAHYQALPPEAQATFKKKGEEAAKEIAGMVRELRLKVSRALQLIRDWLMTIPGVNKFFLEQEAKIKIDKLKDLIAARREDAQNHP